jgi:hypothetical protein
LLGEFEKAEAEAGAVDLGGGEKGGAADDFEEGLLIGETHVVQAENGADVKHFVILRGR